MIYHVTSCTSWQSAILQGFYEADSLATEGFIHASKENQVKGVLERYYQNKKDLVLLQIEESKLTADVKHEWSSTMNEKFPNIFGRINIDAVIKVTPL